MEVAESYGFITKFINDKRSTIRKQAEIATVTLRHEGINYFLDTTKYRISEWQQLKLLDVIRNKEDFQPPRFKAWLTSSNKYVVLFALRLIKYYNQNDASASLIELVKHKNNQIKEEAIGCIKEFNVTESIDTLKMVFWNCSIDIKIAILDAIAEIGTDTDIEFLNLIDKKELNFAVKSKALSSINAISPESIMPSKGIQDESRYKIPDDITEAVAKVHAKKHEDLSGEKDVEFIDQEVVEEIISEEENESPQLQEESIGADEVVEETKIEFIDEEVAFALDVSEESDIPQTDELQDLYEIEVVGEQEIILEEEPSENEFNDAEWEFDHLHFLPVVVPENEQEIEQELFEILDDRSLVPMQDLFNIQVVHEEFMSNEESEVLEEDYLNQEMPSFFEEFNIRELAFLPVVVDNEPETQGAQIEELENEKSNLLDIFVQYGEVDLNSLLETEEVETLLEEQKTNLEPVHELEDMNSVEHKKNNSSLNYKRYQTEEIRRTSVVYDEVVGGADLEPLKIEVIEPDILSSENKSEQTLDVTFMRKDDNDEIELPIENEQLLKKIIDDLIGFNGTKPKQESIEDDSFVNPDWDLDEDHLDIIPVSFEKDGDEPPSFIKIEKTQNNAEDTEINIPSASIPKAIFGDIEFEASTRQLLNDLEEMGDQREIPLLKELLNHEKYDLFKERINKLIDTFNHSVDKEKVDNPLQPFSVFQDLFRTCDNEAKLILLNEVVEVGDEKEIHFLEDLTKDDSPEIRKKALEVLKELKIKLYKNRNELKKQDSNESEKSDDTFDQMKEAELESSSNPNDIFDLTFDLTEEIDEDVDEKKKAYEERQTVQHGSFFGQICSFSHKILEKING